MMARTGARIALVRCLLGLSQEAAGALIGMTQSALSKIEGGKRPLEPDHAIALAREFRLTLDFLYAGESASAVDPSIAQNVQRLRPDLIQAPAVQPLRQHDAARSPKESARASGTLV